VALFTSFCSEIEPSVQVVWLWKSPVTYLPGVLPAAFASGTAARVMLPIAASAAIVMRVWVNREVMQFSWWFLGCSRDVRSLATRSIRRDIRQIVWSRHDDAVNADTRLCDPDIERLHR
jgi:hypothetical protein